MPAGMGQVPCPAGSALNRTQSANLTKIARWAEKTKTGDRDEIRGLRGPLDFWRGISTISENCIGRRCDHYEECHLTTLRKARPREPHPDREPPPAGRRSHRAPDRLRRGPAGLRTPDRGRGAPPRGRGHQQPLGHPLFGGGRPAADRVPPVPPQHRRDPPAGGGGEEAGAVLPGALRMARSGSGRRSAPFRPRRAPRRGQGAAAGGIPPARSTGRGSAGGPGAAREGRPRPRRARGFRAPTGC